MTHSVKTSTRRRGWPAAATAGAVAVGALITVGAGLAAAAPNQYGPSIGTASATPGTGSVALAPRIVTTAGCPADTSFIQAYVDSAAAGLVKAQAIASNDADLPTISTSGVLFSFNFLDIAASQGKTLINGRYELSVICDPGFGAAPSGQFDAVFSVSGGATPTSAGTTYTFESAGPQATTTTISAVPATTAVAGAAVTLTAAVSPAAAAGTVQFEDVVSGSAVDVGAAATVTGGTASVSVTTLSVGAHALRARFVPASTAAFTASTSANLAYTITAAAATPTTTTIAAVPATSAVAGDPVTLTATVAPAAAGAVQFEEVVAGSPVNVGAPASVTGGTATLTTTSLPPGPHTLQARFVPASPATFAPSTSSTIAYTITSAPNPATQTTTELAVSPAGTAEQAVPVTLTATVTPSTAAGSVQFIDGPDGSTVNVGSPVTVSGGTATATASTLSVGSHSLRAVFIPTNAADFASSTSAAVAYTITAGPNPATPTSTMISASPAATATADDPVTFSAAVSPVTAAGTVQFSDGSTALGGPVAVTDGAASVTTSTLAVGSHQLSVVFTPTDPTQFTGSTSVALAYSITPVNNPGAAPTTTTLKAERIGGHGGRWGHREWESAGTDRRCGVGVELEARVRPRAAGTVQFFDSLQGVDHPVGDPVMVRRGKAELVLRPLGAGVHEFTAVFTPADPGAFQGSTSNTATVTVTGKAGAV